MKSKIKVGGLIITHNQDNTIKKSILSMQNQELPLDEIIVVNDSSSDSTKKVLSDFKKRDKRIKTIDTKKQLGPSGALNTGILSTESDILLISGGDDFSLPNRSKVQKELLESNDKALILYNRALINGREEYFHPIESSLSNKLQEGEHFFNLLYWNLNFLCSPASAIKISRQKPIVFNESLIQLQDYFLNLKLSRFNDLIWSDIIVTNYTHSPNSLSGKVAKRSSTEFNRFSNELIFIIKYIFNSMTQKELQTIFHYNLPQELLIHKRTLKNLKQVIQLFLFLSHENEAVQNIGKQYLFELEENPSEKKRIYDILEWRS